MEKTFRLTRSQADLMIEQAKDGDPREVCGMIGGTGSVASKVFPTANVDESDITYQIDPKEQFKIMKTLREDRLELVAIYHSHPETEAKPSSTDIRLAFYPDAHYLIVSLQNKDDPIIRAFKIIGGNVTESRLEIGSD